jgi:hypothetical protein
MSVAQQLGGACNTVDQPELHVAEGTVAPAAAVGLILPTGTAGERCPLSEKGADAVGVDHDATAAAAVAVAALPHYIRSGSSKRKQIIMPWDTAAALRAQVAASGEGCPLSKQEADAAGGRGDAVGLRHRVSAAVGLHHRVSAAPTGSPPTAAAAPTTTAVPGRGRRRPTRTIPRLPWDTAAALRAQVAASGGVGDESYDSDDRSLGQRHQLPAHPPARQERLR